MQIRAGYELIYQFPMPTPMILTLNIHHSRARDLMQPDHLITDPAVPVTAYRDKFDNWCSRLIAPPGRMRLSADAILQDAGVSRAHRPEACQHDVQDLPAETLLFLLGSRYCETDCLADTAWNLFADTPPGWPRVQAICDFVHGHLAFGYQYASPTKSALQAFNDRTGVCRDFAHLAITLCRCMNIPARYCTGYLGDIGVPPHGCADGFFRLVRGVSGRRVVCLRRPPQSSAHRAHPHRPRARCGRRRHQHGVRFGHAGRFPRLDRSGGLAARCAGAIRPQLLAGRIRVLHRQCGQRRVERVVQPGGTAGFLGTLDQRTCLFSLDCRSHGNLRDAFVGGRYGSGIVL